MISEDVEQELVKGVGRQLHRWVVWSICGDGMYALPKWHAAQHQLIHEYTAEAMLRRAAAIEERFPPPPLDGWR